jgi:hypothetical protein
MATSVMNALPASLAAKDLADKVKHLVAASLNGDQQDQQDFAKAAGQSQPSKQIKERDPVIAAVEQAVAKIVASIDSSVNPDTGKPYTTHEKVNLAKDLSDFTGVVEAFTQQRGKVIDWARINPPPKDMIVPYAELSAVDESAKGAYLDKLVVLKLNGGLGTTMGCVGPKSAIEVHSKHTFLDLIVQQITVRLPFIVLVLALRVRVRSQR